MKVDGDTVIMVNKADNSAFVKSVISSGVHHWKFKLTRVQTDTEAFVIGIHKNNVPPPTNTYFTKNENGYGYVCCKGRKTDGEALADGEKYGIECKTGDIVDMHCNLDNLTLSYSVNGQNQGIAYKIEKAEYKAAVNLYYKGNSVMLVQ